MRTEQAQERGVRRWLNENPRAAAAVGGGVILLAMIYIVVTLVNFTSPSVPSYSSGDVKYWYSTEDGQNLYADDALRIPPFEKDGKTFYRAYVFKCPNGQQFVNHIEMYPPDIRSKLEEIKTKSGAPLLEFGQFSASSLIKRVGGPKWLAYNQQETSARVEAQRPRSKHCPEDQAIQITPPGQ